MPPCVGRGDRINPAWHGVGAGVLQVSSAPLDASTSSVHSLCVTAADGQHNSTVLLNVTLRQPDDDDDDDDVAADPVQFSQPFYVLDVAEDWAPGVVVGRVHASVDVVGHRASTSSPPSYGVASLSTTAASSVFNLNATYGILTLAAWLDRETVSL